jgi:hypothetical protein
VLDEFHHPSVIDMIEKPTDVCIQHIIHPPPLERDRQRIQRLMLVPPRSETIREASKIRLVNLVENGDHRLLDNLVFQRCDPQRALSPVGFRDAHPSGWLRSIRPAVYPAVQIDEPIFQPGFRLLPPYAVHAGGRSPLERVKAFPQQPDAQMVKQSGELLLLSFLGCFPYTRQSQGYASPALCRVRAGLMSVLLDQRPSLLTLRNGVPSLFE